MKKICALFILIWTAPFLTVLHCQPGVIYIDAGADITTTCLNPCTTLNATYIAPLETTDYTVSSIPYNPNPFTTGTAIIAGVDDVWSSAIPIPFTFCFYGNSYNKLCVGSNGLITFNIASAGLGCQWQFFYNCPSPNLPSNSVFGPFHDIDPRFGGTIKYVASGTAPYRKFVISWYDVPMYNKYGNCPANIKATHQIVLYESTNVIDVYIKDKAAYPCWNDGNAVVGIQNAFGTTGITPPLRNTLSPDWTATNEAWRFTPGGLSVFILTWWDGSAQIGNGGNPIQVCPSATTTYTAKLDYQTCTGSVTITDQVTVTTQARPVLSLTINNHLVPCCPILTVSGGTPSYGYYWTGPNNFYSGNQNPCPLPGDGMYYVTVWDSNECSTTDSIEVKCYECPPDPCPVWAVGGNNVNNGGHINATFNIDNIIGINDVGVDGSIPPTGSQINTSPFRMFTNSTEKMRILNTGEVGIGIENPSHKLHVHDGSILLTGSNPFGGPMILFGDKTPPNVNPTFTHPNGNWGIEYDGSQNTGGGLNFWKPGGAAGVGFGNYFLFLSDNNGNIGIGTGNPTCKLHVDAGNGCAARFNGSVTINGAGVINTLAIISDSTLKYNINRVPNALGTLSQLQPSTFDFKVNDYPYLNLPTESQFGFIAQEVESVLPNLIKIIDFPEVVDTSGVVLYPASSFKALNYNAFIPIAIAGIQELDSIVSHISTSGLQASCSLNTNYLTKSTGLGSVCNSQIFDNGISVGVGTDAVPASYKMVVEGKFGARDVLVACPPSWPDYVFASDYTFPSLEELESYLSINRHLPGVPTQDDIENAGGLNLGEMQTRQMEKIEELYLYIIEMNKDLQKLGIENNELKQRLQKIENK